MTSNEGSLKPSKIPSKIIKTSFFEPDFARNILNIFLERSKKRLKNRACDLCLYTIHLLLSNDPILDSFAKEAGGQNGECQKTLYEGIFSSQCCHADLLMMSFVFSQQHWPTHHHTILLLLMLLTALISLLFVVTVDFLWWFWLLLTIMAAISFEIFICMSHNYLYHVHIILEWFKSWVAHLRGLCTKEGPFSWAAAML